MGSLKCRWCCFYKRLKYKKSPFLQYVIVEQQGVCMRAYVIRHHVVRLNSSNYGFQQLHAVLLYKWYKNHTFLCDVIVELPVTGYVVHVIEG